MTIDGYLRLQSSFHGHDLQTALAQKDAALQQRDALGLSFERLNKHGTVHNAATEILVPAGIPVPECR